VVARALAPPAVTAECAAPLLAIGGHLVVSDPPGGGGDARWWPAGLAELGLESVPSITASASYAVFVATQPCPQRFPRRPGVPSKRPLWKGST
jgi:16S rRNA (guanine527-N7)-methyltransferase